jgi:hypothetical protein
MPDIMLGGTTASTLPTLAQLHRDAQLSARGQLAHDGERKPYFDRRHCLLLHRLP